MTLKVLDFIICAKDRDGYKNYYADYRVINLVREEGLRLVGESDSYINIVIDFSDVHVWDRLIIYLAKLVVEDGFEIVGLSEADGILLESNVRKIREPRITNVEEFKKMFIARFPKGHICIWDRTLSKNILSNQNKLALVMVEGIERNFVKFRLYKSHMLEPRFVGTRDDGINSKDLYNITSGHITEFMSKEYIFRNASNAREEVIIDILKNVKGLSLNEG